MHKMSAPVFCLLAAAARADLPLIAYGEDFAGSDYNVTHVKRKKRARTHLHKPSHSNSFCRHKTLTHTHSGRAPPA